MTRHSRHSEDELPVGSLVAGRYRVLRAPRRGGTSAVYEAEDLKRTLQHRRTCYVALKVLSNRPDGSPIPQYRIQREVDAARQLQHQTVAALLDVVANEERLMLVFEFIRGPDLVDYLAQCGGRVPEPLARHYFRQLVSAMAHIHSNGLCHRDLKLENVMLDLSQRRLKVIDLGLASAADEAVTLGVGTPDYMCPEMVMGLSGYNPRAVDAWGLGVILYVLVAGHMPFARCEKRPDNIRVLARNIIAANMQPLPGDVSPACAALVLRLLQRDPLARPSMAALAQDPWLQHASSPAEQRLLEACMTAQAQAHAVADSEAAAEDGGRAAQEGKGHGRRHHHHHRPRCHRHRHAHKAHRHQSSRAAQADGGYDSPGLNFDSDGAPDAWRAPTLPSAGRSFDSSKGALPVADSLTSLEALVVREEVQLMHAGSCGRTCKSCSGLYISAPSTPQAQAAGQAAAACFSTEADRQLQEMRTPGPSAAASAAASAMAEVLPASASQHGRHCMVRRLLARATSRIAL